VIKTILDCIWLVDENNNNADLGEEILNNGLKSLKPKMGSFIILDTVNNHCLKLANLLEQ
jgi:hypothetical protein